MLLKAVDRIQLQAVLCQLFSGLIAAEALLVQSVGAHNDLVLGGADIQRSKRKKDFIVLTACSCFDWTIGAFDRTSNQTFDYHARNSTSQSLRRGL